MKIQLQRRIQEATVYTHRTRVAMTKMWELKP
jgi:hypothetical protein